MSSNKARVLALDLGTTAIKVGLFSVNGKQIKKVIREQKLSFIYPGRVEQSLASTWMLIGESIREVINGSNVNDIRAIALSVQRGSVVPISDRGEPLSDMIVWMDERGLPYVERNRIAIPNSKYYKIAGHPLNTITGVSKILWLRNGSEQEWSKVFKLGNQQTLILRWLGCDEWVMDYSVGSFFFPFDITKKTWSSELANTLEVSIDKLPYLVQSTEVIGYLSNEAANFLGLQPGIPLVAGGGDGQCAGAGTGVVTPGKVMVNIGTGAGIQAFLGTPRFDPNLILNCGAHIIPNAWEMEGHTQASGSVFKWFRDEFDNSQENLESRSKSNPYDLLIEQAMTSPPGANGLLVIPTFFGSTAPISDSSARGVIIGLSQSHRKADVIRAILEGISLEIRWILETVEGVGIPIDEIRLSGGGSQNSSWNQIHTDILNRPIRTVQNHDASMTGAAMCAATAIGEYSTLSEASETFVELSSLLEPNPDNSSIYQNMYEYYVDLYKTLSRYKLFSNSQKRSSKTHLIT